MATAVTNTGLKGVIVGTVTTSEVKEYEGLCYRGVPIREILTNSTLFEEVIAFLWDEKIEVSYQSITKNILGQITGCSREAHPMKVLAGVFNFMSMALNERMSYREQRDMLLTFLPSIIAAIYCYSNTGGFNMSFEASNFVDTFMSMARINPEHRDLMDLFLKLHIDHGGGNLSTFTGKVVASGGVDLFAVMSAAMIALSGPKHGGANEKTLDQLMQLGENPTDQEILKWVTETKEPIYGFGHRVLKIEDPRATLLYEFAEKNYFNDPYVQLALRMRTLVPETLRIKKPNITNPYPNVDAISGALLNAAGIPKQCFTLFFALSRCLGIAHQVVVEREAKVPIYRPTYEYV